MSDGRKISCFKCGLDLGVVRDASLRKNTGHICWGCMENVNRKSTLPPGLADIFKKGFRD